MTCLLLVPHNFHKPPWPPWHLPPMTPSSPPNSRTKVGGSARFQLRPPAPAKLMRLGCRGTVFHTWFNNHGCFRKIELMKKFQVDDCPRCLPSWVLQAFSWREPHLTYTLLEIDSCPWYKLSHLTHSRLLGELNSWNVQMLSWLLCWGNIICPPCAAVKRKKGLT